MPIFTADMAGRPTMAYAARDHAEALAFVHRNFIRSELVTLRTTDGASLWDGMADVVVRPASEEERLTWEKRLAETLEDRVFDSREDAIEGGCFAFLVPCKEPTEP